jgi:hypothetical protein
MARPIHNPPACADSPFHRFLGMAHYQTSRRRFRGASASCYKVEPLRKPITVKSAFIVLKSIEATMLSRKDEGF